MVIDARIDLHGHTQDQARAALIAFVRHAWNEGARCLLVITGKGRVGPDGEGQGILRSRFPHWLESPEIERCIAGYSVANAKHGGAGAWYVLLKARTPESGRRA